MGAVNEIFGEYARMRQNGMEAKAALRTLRPYIEALIEDEKAHLAQHIQAWEAGDAPTPTASENTPSKKVIQPLGKKGSPAIRSLQGQQPQDDAATWIACPNCGKKNRRNDVFCYSCGCILEPGRGEYDTRLFADADPSAVSPDYFGPDSVLFLQIRDLDQYFEIRPQQIAQEIIVGRSSGNSAMHPDIDLADYQAAEQGVSRLHMALKYEPNDHVIKAYDLGSANNSFINGQKLHPKEQRVLRHGDEVRLAHLVLRVYFRHPGEEVQE